MAASIFLVASVLLGSLVIQHEVRLWVRDWDMVKHVNSMICSRHRWAGVLGAASVAFWPFDGPDRKERVRRAFETKVDACPECREREEQADGGLT